MLHHQNVLDGKSECRPWCWLTDWSSLICSLAVSSQFGPDVVFGSQRQADFHTSALNHNWLPVEALFPYQRSYCVWNVSLHSCLITETQKIASTRCNRTAVRRKWEMMCVNHMLLSFFTLFLWLVAKRQKKAFNLKLVDKLRNICQGRSLKYNLTLHVQCSNLHWSNPFYTTCRHVCWHGWRNCT